MTTVEASVSSRTVKVDFLTRVEGEGGIYLRLDGSHVEEVKIDIFEPPRFFEGFLRGRHFTEVPDLTARICGICPVAYQMSSAHALEALLGIEITPEIRTLRRLLYAAEYIESHALHIYLLNAPDFLGYESALTLAQHHRGVVEMGLRLKKLGNELLEVLGGRPSHPVSVCVGGFYAAPRKKDLERFRGELEWAIGASEETAKLVSSFHFPHFEVPYEFVSVVHPNEYPLNEKRIASSTGLDLDPAEYERHFLEEHVEHSTALHSVRSDTGSSYFVGPLARIALAFDRLSPKAQAVALSRGVKWPSRNPFHGIVARAIELIHYCDEALAIIENYREPVPSRISYVVKGGEGCAATEAPRGTLYHRYRINRDGLVEFAKITPPTSQNLRRMEDDLRLYLPSAASQDDDAVRSAAERLVRNYDPCISCSTHATPIRIDRS